MLCLHLGLRVNEPHSATVLPRTVDLLCCVGPLRWRLRADVDLDALVGKLAVRSVLATTDPILNCNNLRYSFKLTLRALSTFPR
jgi:hypothetical protein